MRHIAILLPGVAHLGGVARQALTTARVLKQRGWRVSIVVLTGSGGQFAQKLSDDGIAFFTLNMHRAVFDLNGWKQFRKWLREQRPDVVHALEPEAAIVARTSRLLVPIPLQLDTLQAPMASGELARITFHLTSRIPDCVTAVSKGVATLYVDAGLVSKDRLFVLPHGLDLDYWSPDPSGSSEIRQKLGLGHEFVWIATEPLEPIKDYATLLKAFSTIPATSHLLLAGDGTLAEPLKQASGQLGIDSRVHFLGWIDDLRPYLRAADAFVLSSRWEGLPMSLLEASACGLPSAVTDIPGNSDIITHGLTGVLVPPANPDALAAGMNRLMEMEPGERAEMGRQARQTVVERFSLDHVMDQWISLYNGLLGEAK